MAYDIGSNIHGKAKVKPQPQFQIIPPINKFSERIIHKKPAYKSKLRIPANVLGKQHPSVRALLQPATLPATVVPTMGYGYLPAPVSAMGYGPSPVVATKPVKAVAKGRPRQASVAQVIAPSAPVAPVAPVEATLDVPAVQATLTEPTTPPQATPVADTNTIAPYTLNTPPTTVAEVIAPTAIESANVPVDVSTAVKPKGAVAQAQDAVAKLGWDKKAIAIGQTAQSVGSILLGAWQAYEGHQQNKFNKQQQLEERALMRADYNRQLADRQKALNDANPQNQISKEEYIAKYGVKV